MDADFRFFRLGVYRYAKTEKRKKKNTFPMEGVFLFGAIFSRLYISAFFSRRGKPF